MNTTPMTMTKTQLDDYVKALIGPELAELRKANEARGKEMVDIFKEGVSGLQRPQEADKTKGTNLAKLIVAKAAHSRGIENDYTKAVFADVQKQLSAGIPGAGPFSPIIPPGYSQELIELLRNRTCVRRLNPVIVPMPYGQITIPKQTGGSSAAYIGENVGQNASKPSLASVQLIAKKLRVSVTVSNDLIMYSLPAAEAIVRDDMLAQAQVKEDAEFLRGVGSATNPKGLRNWAPPANVIPAGALVDVPTITTDLGSLVAALLSQNVPMIRPGWTISPRTYVSLMGLRHTSDTGYAFRAEMMLGTLWGYPYVVTAQVPTNLGAGSDESEVYLADYNEVLLGESQDMSVETSTEASYLDESGALTSAWSNDQTVVRLIARHDLAMKHDFGVAVLTGVLY